MERPFWTLRANQFSFPPAPVNISARMNRSFLKTIGHSENYIMLWTGWLNLTWASVEWPSKCQNKNHLHVVGEMFQDNQRSETRKSCLRPQGLTLQRTRSFTVCCLMRTREMKFYGHCSVFNSQVDYNSKYYHCAVAFCFYELMLKQTSFHRGGGDM